MDFYFLGGEKGNSTFVFDTSPTAALGLLSSSCSFALAQFWYSLVVVGSDSSLLELGAAVQWALVWLPPPTVPPASTETGGERRNNKRTANQALQ